MVIAHRSCQLVGQLACHLAFYICRLILQSDKGKETEKEKNNNTDLLFHVYAFTGFFLYVTWPEVKSIILGYQDNTLTTELPGQGYYNFLAGSCSSLPITCTDSSHFSLQPILTAAAGVILMT